MNSPVVGHTLKLERGGAVADLLHLRPAQVVAQLGVADQQHRQDHACASSQLHQPLEAGQRLVVQLVGLVDDQHHGMLVLAHEVPQLSLAPFGLLGDLDLATVAGRQVVEHGLDQREQRRAALVDGQRLRHGDPVGPAEFLLDAGQQMRLAGADQARDDDQPAGLRHGVDLADQRALVFGLEVAGPLEGPGQPEMRLHVGEHQPLPAVLKRSPLGATPIGAPIVGWVANHFGLRLALGIGAVSGFAATIVGVYAMTQERHRLEASAVGTRQKSG